MIFDLIFIIFCFASGVVISGAVFAFIVIIGIIPTIITVTKTENKIMLYENVIVLSGIIGTSITFFEFKMFFPKLFLIVVGISWGAFIGCLTMSLAETLDGIPIIARRLKLGQNLSYVVYALLSAKVVGTLLIVAVDLFKNL